VQLLVPHHWRLGGAAECGPLEVKIPLDAELVELILSWPTLSQEIQQQIMLLLG
jgi:hypothetical protein